MVNTGGTGLQSVGLVHTDPPPGHSGLAPEEWAPRPFLTLSVDVAK